jgi:Ax21 family sulfation-dependent quorum factor
MPLAASAADVSYNYVEGGYQNFDLDGAPGADGVNLGGSAALGQHLHVFGSYGNVEIDNSNVDVDLWRLGLGWNTGISDNSHLVVRANYLQVDAGLADAEGWEAEVGLRSAFGANFETYVGLGYVDGDEVDGSGDVYGKLNAQYKFNPTWGLVGSVTLADDRNEYFFGPRISF